MNPLDRAADGSTGVRRAQTPRLAAPNGHLGGALDPATGAGALPPASAPGRDPAQDPAVGAVVADAAPSAGPRTYTIALPAGMELLSQNGRLHHFERNRRAQVLKKAAWLTALKEKIPPLGTEVLLSFSPRAVKSSAKPGPSATRSP